jgi:hypothetical protein
MKKTGVATWIKSRKRLVRQFFLCIQTLAAITIVFGSASVIAEVNNLGLDELRALRYSGDIPSLEGFSPAKVIQLPAPADSHFYTTAYMSKGKCVTFSKLGKDEHDLSIKWKGAKCNGKPINGDGTLQIQYKEDSGTGTYTHLSVSTGHFTNEAVEKVFSYPHRAVNQTKYQGRSWG